MDELVVTVMNGSEPVTVRPRILFVVMSAVSRPDTVDQLATALAPHQVLVHHDFSQTPFFPLAAPNVRFVPDPRRTGWASFGFVDGIFHSLAYAVENVEFDYLQLLSPSCLPIRPLAEFESMVSGDVDAHFGAIDLLADPDCLMSVGYRAFTPVGSFWHRVLRRLSRSYFRDSPGRRDEAGVWLRSGGGKGMEALIARCAVEVFSRGWMGRHPFHSQLRPYYGSVWFGARFAVVRDLVESFRKPGVRDYFSRLRISEEFLVPTLLMQLVRRKGSLSHYINTFDEAHPLPIADSQVGILSTSGAYFARKFPDDPAASIRLQVLNELARVDVAPARRAATFAQPSLEAEDAPASRSSRAPEPAATAGAAVVLGLQRELQSFSGAGRFRR